MTSASILPFVGTRRGSAVRTTARLSGGLCGSLWWPQVLAGKPVHLDLRHVFDRLAGREPATFRDALLHVLREHGGDFQDARFTADTRLEIVCVWHDRTGARRCHEVRGSMRCLPSPGFARGRPSGRAGGDEHGRIRRVLGARFREKWARFDQVGVQNESGSRLG